MTEFKRVFVDTAPIIYYLENSSLYMDAIKKFFTKCIEENIQIDRSGGSKVDKNGEKIYNYLSGTSSRIAICTINRSIRYTVQRKKERKDYG